MKLESVRIPRCLRGAQLPGATEVFDLELTDRQVATIMPARDPVARGTRVSAWVDAHAHIEQLSAAGIVNADTFESATTAAAFGGTTTVTASLDFNVRSVFAIAASNAGSLTVLFGE